MKLTLFCPFAAMTPKRKFVRFGRWSDARTHQLLELLTPYSFRSLSVIAFDACWIRRAQTDALRRQMTDKWEKQRKRERALEQRNWLAWARSRKRALCAITNWNTEWWRTLDGREFQLFKRTRIITYFYYYCLDSTRFFLPRHFYEWLHFIDRACAFFLLNFFFLLLTSHHTWISIERGEKKNQQRVETLNINIIIITYSTKREILHFAVDRKYRIAEKKNNYFYWFICWYNNKCNDGLTYVVDESLRI